MPKIYLIKNNYKAYPLVVILQIRNVSYKFIFDYGKQFSAGNLFKRKKGKKLLQSAIEIIWKTNLS